MDAPGILAEEGCKHVPFHTHLSRFIFHPLLQVRACRVFELSGQSGVHVRRTFGSRFIAVKGSLLIYRACMVAERRFKKNRRLQALGNP